MYFLCIFVAKSNCFLCSWQVKRLFTDSNRFMIIVNHTLRNLGRQWRMLFLFIVLVPLLTMGVMWIYSQLYSYAIQYKWVTMLLITLFTWLSILVCRILTDIFSLQKKETGITICQICIMILVGIWILGFVLVFDAKNHPRLAVALGIVGSLLTWIFQDTLKGIMAFVHLRLNHLLNIDDWIQIPKYNVNGVVKHVTLTTVTFYNWDTTTSSVPTSVLHSDHFINLKQMMDGKTYGRRMLKTFILNTGWFHGISEEEANHLKQKDEIIKYLAKDEIKEGVSNAQLYRIYLFHWLMNHQHISQEPQLMVRWMEQVESGLPLQIYAFITDSNLAAFELQQSQIVEHVLESLEWFGLRLYQSPSAFDINNSNVYISEKPLCQEMGNDYE